VPNPTLALAHVGQAIQMLQHALVTDSEAAQRLCIAFLLAARVMVRADPFS
jgi:hypothetical protein